MRNTNTTVKFEKRGSIYLQTKLHRSNGSALILSLFIIIVLSLLGVALTRILSTGSETVAQEVIGTRALMAANSAMQAQLQQLFPLNSTATCPKSPLTLNGLYNFSAIDGLSHCQVKTSCSLYFTHTETGVNYYRLTSTSQCGSGNISVDGSQSVLSSRSIQVEARSL